MLARTMLAQPKPVRSASRGRAQTGGREVPREREVPADERGSLRGLTGGGPSKVGVDGAMRARDVSRPSVEPVRGGPTRTRRQAPAGSGSSGSSPVDS